MTGCKVDMFKRRLDKYLSTIPDEPQVLGYTAQRRADSNSVLHMAKFVNAHWPSQVEVFGAGDSPSRRGCAYSVAGAQRCPKILQGNKVKDAGYSLSNRTDSRKNIATALFGLNIDNLAKLASALPCSI